MSTVRIPIFSFLESEPGLIAPMKTPELSESAC